MRALLKAERWLEDGPDYGNAMANGQFLGIAAVEPPSTGMVMPVM